MSDLRDLIRACKAEPDDDAPRLILADWLEDHGEAERAAFIRCQVLSPEIVGDGGPTTARWTEPWARLGEEIREANPTDAGLYSVQFRRGFLHISDCYRELYIRLSRILDAPFEWTWVEGICFGSWHNGDWTPLLQSPQLLELNRLEFSADDDRPVLVEPLSVSPNVGNLKHLCLYMIVVGDEGADRLSQSCRLGRLRSLELLSTGIGPAGARCLARSEVWDQLRSCSLRANPLGDAGIAELGSGRYRPELTSLDVAHCDISVDGLLALAKTGRFPRLKELRLGYSELDRDGRVIGGAGLEAILNSPGFQSTAVQLHYVGDVLPPEIEVLGREHPDRLIIERVNVPEMLIDL